MAQPRGSFSDFLSPETADEGPVRTKNIPRQRTKMLRKNRKSRRRMRAT